MQLTEEQFDEIYDRQETRDRYGRDQPAEGYRHPARRRTNRALVLGRWFDHHLQTVATAATRIEGQYDQYGNP